MIPDHAVRPAATRVRTFYTIAILAWLLAVFTGTAASPHYGALITSSIAFAIAHFLAVHRLLRSAPKRRWLLVPAAALYWLTVENLERLMYTIEHSRW